MASSSRSGPQFTTFETVSPRQEDLARPAGLSRWRAIDKREKKFKERKRGGPRHAQLPGRTQLDNKLDEQISMPGGGLKLPSTAKADVEEAKLFFSSSSSGVMATWREFRAIWPAGQQSARSRHIWRTLARETDDRVKKTIKAAAHRSRAHKRHGPSCAGGRPRFVSIQQRQN